MEGGRIGRYVTERALGAGSFATVWLAYDELLETRVAIKVLADNWSRNPAVRQRFVEEARILRRIDHDRIVRVHEINELADGRPYFLMALADRGTLHDRLAKQDDDGLAVVDALQLCIEICEALAVVHDFGVVHRDIKPSNILFRSVRSHERIAAQRAGKQLGDEAIMLGDFGLAKDLAAASGFTLAAGTPAYMAPEQAQSAAVIDRRVDVFAVTAVLYEMLTGRAAFASDTLSGVRRSRANTPADRLSEHRSGLPTDLERIVDRGLAHSPDDRYPSVLALSAALEEVLASLSAPSVPVAAGVPLPPPTAPAPPPASLGGDGPIGASGRVLDLIASVRGRITSPEGREMVARAEARLSRPLTVVVVPNGSSAAATVSGHIGTAPVVEVIVAPSFDAQAVGEADLVVLLVPSDAPAPEQLVLDTVTALRGAVAGAVALEALVVGDAAGPDPVALAAALRSAPTVGALVSTAEPLTQDALTRLRSLTDELVGHRALLIRAAGGLKLLAAAAASGGAAPPDVRADILDGVEALRSEIPALVEIDVLHDLTSGTASLPRELRAELRRLFLHARPAARLGLDADADAATLRAAVEDASTRWRVLENTGRIPFSARRAMLIAQQSLDRLFAELHPYGS